MSDISSETLKNTARIHADRVREASEDLETSDSEHFIVSGESELTPVLSVVMPTLNEEAGIAECIARIKSAVSELQVPTEIIVSDSSTDRTPEIARSHGAVVVMPDEDGYGYAYRYAFKYARGNYIAIADADTTYDFEELPQLFESVYRGDADIVIGSRFDGEIKPGAMPLLHKYVGNPLLTRFLNAFYDAGVSDAHSGFRVFTRDTLEKLDLGSDGMEFASEMVMEAAARDLTIEEVPITYQEREGDPTLDSVRDGWRHVKFMLVNAPGYLFSVPGALLALTGLTVMLLAYFDISVLRINFGVHSMIAGSLLVIVGYQITSFGIFTTIAGDPIKKPNDPATTWFLEHASLERGVTIGGIMFMIGAIYATYLLAEWIQSGFTKLPFVMADVVAFTAIILGVQTVFGSFFMSALAEQ